MASPFVYLANLVDLKLSRTPLFCGGFVATATHTWGWIQSSRHEECWQTRARDWMNRCRGDHQTHPSSGQEGHRRSELRWPPHP